MAWKEFIVNSIVWLSIIFGFIGISFLFTALVHRRLKISKKTCEFCEYYVREYNGRELCSYELMDESLPMFRTCTSFRKGIGNDTQTEKL